jgi:hypothetical protein
MTSQEDRDKAAELAARARELHERKEYYEARPLYQESLRLHEDEDVRRAYSRLMATIGPM